MKQQLNEEFRRMQKLAGLINENQSKDLLQFIKTNKDEIAQKLDFVRLEDIRIDDLGDAGAIGIYTDEDNTEGESGLAFRFPEDVDEDFYGESGDKPRPITIAGKDLMYVGYNI